MDDEDFWRWYRKVFDKRSPRSFFYELRRRVSAERKERRREWSRKYREKNRERILEYILDYKRRKRAAETKEQGDARRKKAREYKRKRRAKLRRPKREKDV